MWVVARTDLRQLIQSKDYWIPMVALGSLFFFVIPTVLLLTITSIGDINVVQQASQALKILPPQAQAQIQGQSPQGRTAFALAVYLFAPVAVVVPLTISTAVGAATLVGERERGTGEFLAHSPASVREIYLGKLFASFVPGYLTTLVGFGMYSMVVNLVVGPEVLPDPRMVGPDAVDHAAVPAADAVARPSALGTSAIDGRSAAGVGPDHVADDRHRLQPVDRHVARGLIRDRLDPGSHRLGRRGDQPAHRRALGHPGAPARRRPVVGRPARSEAGGHRIRTRRAPDQSPERTETRSGVEW
jgi:hypothetical protein